MYLYGGSTRETIDTAVEPGNEAAMSGNTYSISADSGLIVVVVPIKDQETELEFTYWQGVDEATKEEDGSSVFLATVIATAVLVLCILVSGYGIFKALKNRKN